MTKNVAGFFTLFLFTLALSACGSDDSGVTTNIGMTTIPKSTGAVQKTAFAAASTVCPTKTANFTDHFTVGDGEIYILEAVAIVNEVEFDQAGNPEIDDPNSPSFAVDLTNNDPDIPNFVSVTVPDGTFDRLKYKVQRIEDDPGEQPVGVNLNALLTKIGFASNPDTRPSVWVKAVAEVGATCTDFQFVTDKRSRVSIPLVNTVDPSAVDTTLQFDLETAFKAATNTSALVAEVIDTPGGGSKALSAGFLDGRVRVSGEGTPNAQAVANLLAVSVEVFTVTAGSSTFDDNNPGVDDGATHNTPDDGNPATDDNPSCSDLDAPAGTCT